MMKNYLIDGKKSIVFQINIYLHDINKSSFYSQIFKKNISQMLGLTKLQKNENDNKKKNLKKLDQFLIV